MAMKDFDFKQFLLKRGEWVLLGVALVVTLLLLWVGLPNILLSGSPTANANEFAGLTRNANERIDRSAPPSGTDAVPEDIEKLSSGISFKPVDPEPFRTDLEWFYVTSLDDSKRRNPEVLAPIEFQTDVVRAGVRGNIIIGEKNRLRVLVLSSKAIGLAREKKTGRIIRFRQGVAGSTGAGGGKAGGGLGTMGPGPGTGDGPPAGERSAGTRPGLNTPGSVTRTELMDLDKVKDDTHLAETIYPAQMVVVSAPFPLRQQLEEFRRALRKKSLTELLAMFDSGDATWQFLPLEIERRELADDGKPKTDWEPYSKKMLERLQEYLLVAASPEEEDKELLESGIITKGLVLIRPPLAPEGQPRAKYPDVNLPGIKETLDELKKVGAEDADKRPKSALADRIGRRDKAKGAFDYWNAPNPIGDEEEDKTKEQSPKPPADADMKPKDGKDPSTDPDADLVLPKNVLVRFVDLGVRSGATYEYRLKIKMANPNYQQKNVAYQKLAEKKEIEAAEWTVVPKVTVPHESVWYVADEKPDKDKAVVQVHEWVANVSPSADTQGVSVGDWTILEKTFAYRGEYIGRTADVEVPIWRTENEGYELAAKVGSKLGIRKIPIDFTVRASNAQEPTLLVDFEGGKGVQVRIETRNPDGKPVSRSVTDDSPVQLLVLTPDGKLILRNSADDSANEEREKRFKEWKEWVDLVKRGGKSNLAGRPEDMFNKGGGRPGN